MDLETLLVSLYVLVDDWWKGAHPATARKRPGRPLSLSVSEVLTLAILAQGPGSAASETSSGSPMPTFAPTSLTS